MWAYPDGIKIYDNHLHILNDSEPEFTFFENSDILVSETSSTKFPPEYLYSFVLTDYSLNRTYCTCLVWNVIFWLGRNGISSRMIETTIIILRLWGTWDRIWVKIKKRCFLCPNKNILWLFRSVRYKLWLIIR